MASYVKRPATVDFSFSEFAAEVAGMHPCAVGIYIRLLCYQWANGHVPRCTVTAMRIAGASPEDFEAHWATVGARFQTADYGLVNIHARSLIEKKMAISEARSACGRMGGRPKKANQKQTKSKRKAIALAEKAIAFVQTPATTQDTQTSCDEEKAIAFEKEAIALGPSTPQKSAPVTADRSAEILQVFDHYRVFHPRSLKSPLPSSKEWKLIADRLKEGFDVEDLRLAIDGCHKTPHNMGINDRGTKYLELALIMRDGSHVTRFMEADSNTQIMSEKEQRSLLAVEQWARNEGERA